MAVDPPECDDRPDRGRVPAGLLGSLVMLALVEWGLARHDLFLSGPLVMNWSQGGETLRREAPRAEVLCLGDSLMKCGVAPRVLEDRLGVRAYNGAVLASTPPMTYLLARRALDAGARPSALVVEFNPSFLGGPPQGSRQWPEMATPRECLALARDARDPGFFAGAMAGGAFRSVRRRQEVRANIMAALGGEAVGLPATIQAGWRNWNVNRGAMLMPPYEFHGTIDPAQMASVYAPKGWSCHPVNALYIRRLLRLAATKGVPVVWLLPPVSPQVQSGRDAAGLEDAHTRFVLAMQARSPGLVVVDGRRSGYGPSAFADPIHLNIHAAAALSDDLANALRPTVERRPGRPRWVVLPEYRERPAGVPLEDLDQSRVAVRDFATGPRR